MLEMAKWQFTLGSHFVLLLAENPAPFPIFPLACHIEWHSRACLYISLRLAMAAKRGRLKSQWKTGGVG